MDIYKNFSDVDQESKSQYPLTSGFQSKGPSGPPQLKPLVTPLIIAM